MQSRIRFSIILVSLMLFAGASPAGDLGGPRPQNHMQAIDSAEIPTCIPITMHPDNGARIVITLTEIGEDHISLSWKNNTMAGGVLRFDFQVERDDSILQDNTTEGWFYGEDVSSTPSGSQTLYFGEVSTGVNDRNISLESGDRIQVLERTRYEFFYEAQEEDSDSIPFLDRDGWYIFGEAPDYSNTEDCYLEIYPLNAQSAGGSQISIFANGLPYFYKREAALFNNGSAQTDVVANLTILWYMPGLRVWNSDRTQQLEFEYYDDNQSIYSFLLVHLPVLPAGNSSIWLTTGDEELPDASRNLSALNLADPQPVVNIADSVEDMIVYIGGEEMLNTTDYAWGGPDLITPPLQHGYHDVVIELANGKRYKSSDRLRIADYYNSTGSEQYYIVPDGVSELGVKLWGAGGGGSSPSNGGAGGFVSGILDVEPGQNLTLIVGGGGGWHKESCTNPNPGFGGYAGGGTGSQGGGGGGYTAIFDGERLLALAGGGGGSGDGMRSGGGGHGGAGGGLSGQNGSTGVISNNASMGGGQEPYGGTMYLQGGGPIENGGWTLGGGGGGGYYGGTGGYRQGSWQHRPGGGGSSFIDNLTDGVTIAGDLRVPPMLEDPDYVYGTAYGGPTANEGCQYVAGVGSTGSVAISLDAQSAASEEEGVEQGGVAGLLQALIDLLPDTPQEIAVTGAVAGSGGAAFYFVKVRRYRNLKEELLTKLVGRRLDSDISRERFEQRWAVLRVVSFMRWLTLVLGPISWGWDEVVYDRIKERLSSLGISDIFTLEGMFEWIFYELLSFLPLGTVETFRRIFGHVRIISTVLFVLFFSWAYFARGFVKDEALRMAEFGIDETSVVEERTQQASEAESEPREKSVEARRSRYGAASQSIPPEGGGKATQDTYPPQE